MTEVAREYGAALYQLAVEEQLEEQILEEFAVLAQQFRENLDYVELLSTPVLPKAQRLQIADEAFRGKVNGYLLNFLKILIENGTANQFALCQQQYESLYHKAHGIEKATAITAVPLSEELCEKLKAKLEQVTGKKVILSNRVDPRVLGGVSIEMDGKMLDDSLRTRLETIRHNLIDVIV